MVVEAVAWVVLVDWELVRDVAAVVAGVATAVEVVVSSAWLIVAISVSKCLHHYKQQNSVPSDIMFPRDVWPSEVIYLTNPEVHLASELATIAH